MTPFRLVRLLVATVVMVAGVLAGADACAATPHATAREVLDRVDQPAQAVLTAAPAGVVHALEMRGRGFPLRLSLHRSPAFGPFPPDAHGAGTCRAFACSTEHAFGQVLHFGRAAADGHHTSTPPPENRA